MSTDFQKVQALLALQDAAVRVGAALRENPSEDFAQAANRLEQSYATINVAVGVPAKDLVVLLRAIDAALVIPAGTPESLAQASEVMTNRRATYGPQLRQGTQTLPPGTSNAPQ